MVRPPNAMMAGKGLVPFGGYVISGVNDIVLPFIETVTVRFEPEMEPNTVSGCPGLTPSSRVWKSSLTSRWRHAKSERVLTGLPLANLKGSGSFAS